MTMPSFGQPPNVPFATPSPVPGAARQTTLDPPPAITSHPAKPPAEPRARTGRPEADGPPAPGPSEPAEPMQAPPHPAALATPAEAAPANGTTPMAPQAVDGHPPPVSGSAPIADTAPAPATHLGRPPPPTEQLAPVLVRLVSQPGGPQTMTVRLDPADLGAVHIRVNRTETGMAHVDIAAARPETLALLRADQSGLRQALNQAGVPADARGITFQLSPPTPAETGFSRPDGSSAGLDFGGQGGGGWQPNGGHGGQHPGGDPRGGQQRPAARWFRAGLDITA